MNRDIIKLIYFWLSKFDTISTFFDENINDNAGFLDDKVIISLLTKKLFYPKICGTNLSMSYKKRRLCLGFKCKIDGTSLARIAKIENFKFNFLHNFLVIQLIVAAFYITF